MQNSLNQLSKPISVPTPLGASNSLQKTSAFSVAEMEAAVLPTQSLFERFAWLYIFCRENLFRDDTDRIVRAFWPSGEPTPGTNVIEFGCGPGFYSRRLAEKFPQISVLGVDRSARQINPARAKARRESLGNCLFEQRNVLHLASANESFDCLIASRLFTVLRRREHAIEEMWRVLRKGGRCFVAEPRYAVWASIPLFAMWLLASFTRYRGEFREPRRAAVLTSEAFQKLLRSQPWTNVKIWRDGRYQYALCEKG